MLRTVSLSLKMCLPYANPHSTSKAKEHSRVLAAGIKQETGFQVQQAADYLRQEHWPRLTSSFVCRKFSLLTSTGEDACPNFSGFISATQLMSPAYKEEDHVRLGKQNDGRHSFQPARKSCHHVAYGRGPRLFSQGFSGQIVCALVKPETFKSADVTWWGRPASYSLSRFQCGLFLKVHTLEVWSASWQCGENRGLLELDSSRISTGQLEGCPKKGSSEL